MNNNIKKIKRDNVTFVLENGLLHNTLGPAVFSDDLNYKEWYINGVLHREDDLAAMMYLNEDFYSSAKNGRISEGYISGLKKPTFLIGEESWYMQGEWENDSGSIFFYKNGVVDNGDEPAIISNNGNKRWYKDGFLHRENDLPATESKFLIEWFKHGLAHRENGPAAIFFLPQDEVLNKWYLEGKQYTEEDFLSIYNSKVLKESLNNLSSKKSIKI